MTETSTFLVAVMILWANTHIKTCGTVSFKYGSLLYIDYNRIKLFKNHCISEISSKRSTPNQARTQLSDLLSTAAAEQEGFPSPSKSEMGPYSNISRSDMISLGRALHCQKPSIKSHLRESPEDTTGQRERMRVLVRQEGRPFVLMNVRKARLGTQAPSRAPEQASPYTNRASHRLLDAL